MRVLLGGLAGLAVLALVGVFALGRAGLPLTSLPLQMPRWAPACQLLGEGGTVVLDGSIETMTAAVQMALSNDPDAPREAAPERVGAQEATADQVRVAADQADSEDIAAAVAAGPALTCRVAPIRATDTAKEQPIGLTPAARAPREEARAQFGRLPDGGFGPEEVLPGRRADGAHSQGRAIGVFFRPMDDPDQAAAGWRLANWAVANAERLRIRTVIYRDHIWSAWRPGQGWRDYEFAGPDPENPINRHLDHVHLDVA